MLVHFLLGYPRVGSHQYHEKGTELLTIANLREVIIERSNNGTVRFLRGFNSHLALQADVSQVLFHLKHNLGNSYIRPRTNEILILLRKFTSSFQSFLFQLFWMSACPFPNPKYLVDMNKWLFEKRM